MANLFAAEIIKIMGEFEASVTEAEAALVLRDWARIDALLSTQHRLTHALTNALDESRDVRPQAFTDEVNRRLRGIVEKRDDQMRRLIAFNHLVKQRLTIISRSREMRRVNVDKRPAARVLDLLQ